MQWKTHILNIFVELYITIENNFHEFTNKETTGAFSESTFSNLIPKLTIIKPIWWGMQINFEQRVLEDFRWINN